MNNLSYSKPIVSIEDFFSNSSWPLPKHDLEQSPCRSIIDSGRFETMGRAYYYCKVHPSVWNIDLVGIEHHCRYQDTEKHKAAILESPSIKD
jgi:hypothetical protein